MATTKFIDKYPNEQLDIVIASGSISSEFDEYGTLRLNYDEENIQTSAITIPLISDIYDNSAVEESYDLAFTEIELDLT